MWLSGNPWPGIFEGGPPVRCERKLPCVPVAPKLLDAEANAECSSSQVRDELVASGQKSSLHQRSKPIEVVPKAIIDSIGWHAANPASDA